MRRATYKDMRPVTQKTAKFGEAVKKSLGQADLKDHGGHATVTMAWNLNKLAIRDHIFSLTINGEKAYLDLEELLSYTRLI